MRKLAGVLFVFFLLQWDVSAQDTLRASNYLGLEYGIRHVADQDLIFSPFILNDWTAFDLCIMYKRYSADWAQRAEISFDRFNPIYHDNYIYYSNPDSSEKLTIDDDFTFVRATYGIGKYIKSTSKVSVISGIMSDNIVMAKNYYAGDFSTFGYFASFGISYWSQFGLKLKGKNSSSITFHFPLFAWVCRSPYLANDDQFIENTVSHNGFKTFFAYVHDGKLETLNHFQQLDIDLSYTYNLSTKFRIGGDYRLSLVHNSEPVALMSIQNGLSIKLLMLL